MGHKEAIVLVLIFPHIIILVLEEKEKSSHIENTDTQAGTDGLAEPKGQHWPHMCPSTKVHLGTTASGQQDPIRSQESGEPGGNE